MTINEALNIIQGNKSPEERRFAFEYIIESKIYNEDIIHILASGLVDGYRGVRDICSRGLIKIPKEFAGYVALMVVPLIAHNDIEIRNLAGDLLLKLEENSIDALLPFLENASEDVRKYACDILGIVGKISNLINIYPLLNDKDVNVINSAIEAIGNICFNVNSNTTDLQEPFNKLNALFEREIDSKPNIIDAIGKIGGKNAEDFLVNQLHNEKDEFLKVAFIDALSICGNNKNVCEQLINELEFNSKEIQVVILKTIYAILYRIDDFITLPDHLRFVAHNALFDEDADIRGAGLLSLGLVYFPEDKKSLVNEILHNNGGTAQHILYNLLAHSSIDTVRELFEEYHNSIKQNNPLGIEMDLLETISFVWEGAEPENLAVAFEVFLNSAFELAKGQEADVFELLRKMDSTVANQSLLKVMAESNKEQQNRIMELIKALEIEEIYDTAHSIIQII